MAIDLEVHLTRLKPDAPYGERLLVLNRITELEYVRGLNEVGTLTLKHDAELDKVIRGYGGVNGDSLFDMLRAPDTIIEVHMQVDGRRFLDGNTFWWGRYINLDQATDGIVWKGFDNKGVLPRRIVPYPASTDSYIVPQTRKELPADDFMKAVVADNFGPDTIDPSFGNYQLSIPDPTRDMSAMMAVEAPVSLAPVVKKSFAHRRVSDVIRDLSRDSAELGADLWYDVVTIDPNFGSPFLEFRTYVGQPGNDYSMGSPEPRYFGFKQGNLPNEKLVEDYRNETNVVYAKGRGEGVQRASAVAMDGARVAASPLNRHEQFLDSRNTLDVGVLLDDATARLQKGKPVKELSGTILNSPSKLYGRDFLLGDRVVGDTLYGNYDCLIHKVKVRFDKNGLRIDAQLKGELIES